MRSTSAHSRTLISRCFAALSNNNSCLGKFDRPSITSAQFSRVIQLALRIDPDPVALGCRPCTAWISTCFLTGQYVDKPTTKQLQRINVFLSSNQTPHCASWLPGEWTSPVLASGEEQSIDGCQKQRNSERVRDIRQAVTKGNPASSYAPDCTTAATATRRRRPCGSRGSRNPRCRRFRGSRP